MIQYDVICQCLTCAKKLTAESNAWTTSLPVTGRYGFVLRVRKFSYSMIWQCVMCAEKPTGSQLLPWLHVK